MERHFDGWQGNGARSGLIGVFESRLIITGFGMVPDSNPNQEQVKPPFLSSPPPKGFLHPSR